MLLAFQMANIAWIVVAVACLAAATDSADILVVAPIPTRSHYNVFDKLAVQLANRGHRVTVIAPFKQAKPVPNMEEIVLENLFEMLMGNVNKNFSTRPLSLVADR